MNHPTQAVCRQPQRGVSLVESLICLAILATLLTGAIMGLRHLPGRHLVEATAELLETDLRLARSQALVVDDSVRFAVQSHGDGSTCYVVYQGAAGSCTCQPAGRSMCVADGATLRVAHQPADRGVRIVHSGKPLLFAAGKGTVTPTATLVVVDRDGQAIHQVVNLMGRTRTCSPSGLSGLRRC